ncbi:MAG: hypothetical protein U0234_24885 [Sandaracinus sp.]
MSLRSAVLVLLVVPVLAPGCGGGTLGADDSGGGDAGATDGGGPAPDGALRDASSALDGAARDGGGPGEDAATSADASGGGDAWALDAWADVDAAIDDAAVDLPDVMLADAGIAPCSPGWTLCGDTCRDLTSDTQACGRCDFDCRGPHTLGAACAGAACSVTACELGFADANGVASDGCEAAQDFTITLDAPTVVVSAGGSATVGVTIDRQNGFFPQITSTITGIPAALFATPALTSATETRAVIRIDASATATAGTYTAQVTAGAGLGSTSFVHSAPLSVQVVSTPVRVTSVEVLYGSAPLPGNEIPQGLTPVTLRVHGSGLLAVLSAGLDTLELTDVAGATDTTRAYELGVPHGFPIGEGRRPLDLVLHVAGGGVGASVAGAVTVTDLHVAPDGNDAAGIGSWASPVQTIDRALALARGGDIVSLEAMGSFAPAATPAPDGLVAVRGDADIVCSTAAPVGLETRTPVRVEGVRLVGCDVALRVQDGSLGTTVVDGVRIEGSPQPFDIATPGGIPLVVIDSVLEGPPSGGVMRFTHGQVRFTTTRVRAYRVEAAGAQLSIGGSNLQTDVGDALVIGPSSAESSIVNSFVTARNGDAVRVSPAATLSLDAVQLQSSRRGLVVDGGVAHIDSVTAYDNADVAFLVTGASPSVTFGIGTLMALSSSATSNEGTGLRIAPTSGTATVTTTAYYSHGNRGGGIDVQNAAGAATVLTLGGCYVGDDGFGLRIAGGTTTLDPSSSIDGSVSEDTANLVELVSGTGTLAFTTGSWWIHRGTGIAIEGASRHTVLLGGTSRSLTIDLTSHPYDGHFGIIDDRGQTGTATSARVAFVGSDGAARTWSGVYTNTGSYSVSVTPRDYAAWLVAHAGRIDFGAP